MTLLPAISVTDSDEVLATRMIGGEIAAFDALVTRHRAGVYRLARRLAKNPSDAEEITQDAFLQALRSIGSFRGEARFSTWLFRIAANEALMRRRANARRPAQSLDALSASCGADLGAPADRTPGADDLLARYQTIKQVRDALDTLDAGQREAVTLRDLDGLSSKEAARTLGTSPATVRQRAHRGRLRLLGLLGHLARAA